MTAKSSNQAFTHFAPRIGAESAMRHAITALTRKSEAKCLAPLLDTATLADAIRTSIANSSIQLIERLRAKRRPLGVQALMQEFALSSDEGIALMCLAEALLRIPDKETRDLLIRDKVANGNWQSHLGGDKPLFVNAAIWGLVITGKMSSNTDDIGIAGALSKLIMRLGKPAVRRCVDTAMRMLGEQFVAGQSIDEALRRSRKREARGYSFSYDMLGEAATTASDADRYYADYVRALHAIGHASNGRGIEAGPGISIKLSALHPRYERSQANRIMDELLPRVQHLAELASSYGIGLNIDAEEADRLEVSLDILQALAESSSLTGWHGLGFVIQAYQKRCPAVIDWIVELASSTGKRIMVRLVKGAYWDAEIKRAQVDGLIDFPVYTRKIQTDVAYIACARKLLDARKHVFPQFATHNAQTLATVYHLAGPDFTIGDYEFQCLHGMGEALYDEVVGPTKLNRPCRVYAPVGTHETLLAYLVRRLLENGANTSFINRINDPLIPIEELTADPAEVVRSRPELCEAHESIALPSAIYKDRRNSSGLDLSDEHALAALTDALVTSAKCEWVAGELYPTRTSEPVLNPANRRDVVGYVHRPTEADARNAARIALTAAPNWRAVSTCERAACLERAADIMQAQMPQLMGLIMREAGKSAANAVTEVREAIDFLRYYPAQARRALRNSQPMGPFVCISPWNFPLAIFTGQVAAALVAGNPVMAKPSSETPLIAAAAVRILHDAGVPKEVLQLIPGNGAIGAALISAKETAGVVFTGSTGVARVIQNLLAGRVGASGAPIPLIAETGGLNAMVVDSSALAEQVVADVIASAFDSAGQRCSALRLLCLQEEIAERTLGMIKEAMMELKVGDTSQLFVDVGPVISTKARDEIQTHIEGMRARGFPVVQANVGGYERLGSFVAPTVIELPDISELGPEVFGPVLHVIRFNNGKIEDVVDSINRTGFGLTFGLHTRIDQTIEKVSNRILAGNIYINRNIIGAVVGVQPFGGRGLSGTGPKAGGSVYVTRFAQGAKCTLESGGAAQDLILRAFKEWANAEGFASIESAVKDYVKSTRLGREVELQGPVGEKNLYKFNSRGRIALIASSEERLWNQVAAVLATGNTAAIIAGNPVLERPANFPTILAERVIWTDRELSQVEGIATVLIDASRETIIEITRVLASREGAIVTPHCPTPASRGSCSPRYDLDTLLEEVSISVNTAAAGGNASLMAIA